MTSGGLHGPAASLGRGPDRAKESTELDEGTWRGESGRTLRETSGGRRPALGFAVEGSRALSDMEDRKLTLQTQKKIAIIKKKHKKASPSSSASSKETWNGVSAAPAWLPAAIALKTPQRVTARKNARCEGVTRGGRADELILWAS